MKKKTTPKTPKTVYISVFDIVGKSYCYTPDEGKKVYRRIYPAIARGDKVVLSFRDVDDFLPPFMGAIIGKLYEKFSEKDIRKSLKIEDLGQDDMERIERIKHEIKWYLADPEGYERAFEDAMYG